MMEEKKSVFDYIGELFATFGIITVIFMVIIMGLGEIAAGYSPFFEYGKNALSVSLLFQWFCLSVIISICRNLFLTDRWVRQMSIPVRNTLFFLAITVAIIIFVIVFKWFPLFDIKAWIGFVVSFALCSSIAIVIGRLKENAENRKMEQALDRFKNE